MGARRFVERATFILIARRRGVLPDAIQTASARVL